MGKSAKPRKKMQARRVLVNPIHAAIMRATKLTPDEREQLIGPVKECFDLLRQGKWTNAEFKHMADAMNVAQALTMPGTGLLPDHEDKFDAAQEALKALATRRNAGGNWVAKASELMAIQTGIEYHEIQLQFASAGELARATKLVDDTIRGARSGSPGKDHIHTTLRPE